jgi:hypothetical protein
LPAFACFLGVWPGLETWALILSPTLRTRLIDVSI